MKSGGLFAGYGGLDMAVAEVFGAEPVWFSEIDDAPSKILAHHWPDVPNLGDITKIDWDEVEPVDILSGGFPCQDVSAAGKRAGMHPDNRSGLWNHMAYAISKLRPRYVVAENVRGLLSAEAHSDVEPCPWCLGDGPGEPALRALGAVLGDLAELGYDARGCGIRAADVGAPHGRFRFFILAEDADLAARGERWVAAPGQTEGRGAWTDTGGRDRAPAADTDDNTEGHGRPTAGASGSRTEPAQCGGPPAAYSASNGWHEGRSESAREFRGPDAAERGAGAAADSAFERRRTARRYDGIRTAGLVASDIGWGQYAPAIHRWEQVLGRGAPAPTEVGAKGGQRLSPRFVEWMMGLPAGHVTAVPGVNRNAQLKALGNGVVPQQAIAALRHMYTAERWEVA